MDTQKQLVQLTKGTVQVLPQDELKKKLATKERLRVKLGADPTAPDLHLGHAVVLKKLRDFQELGHEIIFLIGDYTARIGDPSGKSKTRPILDEAAIEENMRSYFQQVGKILDSHTLTVVYNSEWLDALSSSDVIKLCAKVTLAQIAEREDFAKRIAEHKPIGLHELMYPLLQAYDSVALKADVELGGTDQTFNLLLGRDVQEAYGQDPQVVMTMPLLEGLDGVQKMSKSLGNAVGLHEPAVDAYGKLMSISDDLMWRYFDVLLEKSQQEIDAMKQQVADGKVHPMDLKKQMAHTIIVQFWSEAEADQAQKQFQTLFQKRDMSAAQQVQLPADLDSPLWIVALLKELGVVKTTSEGKRLIEQKAVSIDEQPITDFKAQVPLHNGMIVKAGKHKIFKLAVGS